jgi:hypothetical protein
VQPTNLFAKFKEQGDKLAKVSEHDNYAPVFDLLDILLTVDYR